MTTVLLHSRLTATAWNQSAQLSAGPVLRSVRLIYVVSQYNKYMGGVNCMDQNIATYRISIRSRKWWWPLFAYLLDVVMQNAWIIYQQTEGAQHRPLDQLEFRRDICSIYYTRYSFQRPSIGRPLGRPRHLDT